MGKNTEISWCDHTFNPWWGCVEVSPACDNCYARELDKRFQILGQTHWGKDAPRRSMSEEYWKQPLKWNRSAVKAGGGPPRVFCASMCDVMEEQTGDGGFMDHERKRLYDLIEHTANLDWLLLTKRPQNFRRFLPASWMENPRPNVWLMTTVESHEYTWRIDELLKVPAVVHGVSYEPALGPVDFAPYVCHPDDDPIQEEMDQCCPRLNWMVVGGESGRNARPSHPDWFRSVLDACQASAVSFHFKQHGEWLAGSQMGADGDKPTAGNTGAKWGIVDRAGGFFPWTTAWNGKTGEYSDTGEEYVYRVGKKAAGRMLDGKTWNEFPNARQRIDFS